MYEKTLSLIIELEAFLLEGRLSSSTLLRLLQRLLWLPLKFLKMGVKEKTNGIFLWAYIAFAAAFIGVGLIESIGLAKTEAANIMNLTLMLAPALLVLFSLPSFYAHSGVTPDAVNFVVDFLGKNGFQSEKEVELLKKSIKPIEERSRNRVTALKWIVGLIWASFIYTFSKVLEPSQSTMAGIASSLWTLAIMALTLIAAYLLVWGYEAALDKLFKAVEFGCNDFCYSLEVAKRNPA
ncbi:MULTISPECIES: hypothetical protein [unclassified Duganella]|uniref:hypothetical protein n=1 Tax=unclassified Duganella TaxID=2636909 RepID=UPI0006F242CF|nr:MULTISPECIES: hypothetical protein [unclassified Duganella]KQV44730.1 hypothetical protein ASD07_19435 [Duganella sp. Root336D2]KRB83252.1 hypothetical protein ASE26_12275 [Duganella sp. Root198D2]